AGALLSNKGASFNKTGALLFNKGALSSKRGALVSNKGTLLSKTGALLANKGAWFAEKRELPSAVFTCHSTLHIGWERANRSRNEKIIQVLFILPQANFEEQACFTVQIRQICISIANHFGARRK
ncbi:MAG: hypothetical protein ACREDS_08860, partial [Limisphaerales bacterium]